MKTRFLLLLLLVVLSAAAGAQRSYDLRGQQFATCGTDFWVCFPRTFGGMSGNYPCLYVMSERNCELTLSNEAMHFSQTFPILTHRIPNGRLDTINLIQIPLSLTRYADTLSYASYPPPLPVHGEDLSNQEGYSPQYAAFHVTTTDTVALYLFIYTAGSCDVTNVLPTEMLRDEYVTQSYPKTEEPTSRDRSPSAQFIEILAAEDSTVVDITLGDWDWMNRPKNSTFSVTINRGQLFHIGAGEYREKYYPKFPPYGYDTSNHVIPILTHAFVPKIDSLDTCYIDLSGTHILARDHKRIAVFEGSSSSHVPSYVRSYADFLIEQSLPVRYAGCEYLLPNLSFSTHDYIRFTGLADSTVITIFDASRRSNNTRTLTVDSLETEWFQMDEGEGPFYVSADRPFIVKMYSDEGGALGGPAMIAPVPIKWWGRGMGLNATIYWCDNNHNRYTRRSATHVLALNPGADSLLIDDYLLDTIFPFSTVTGTDIEHTFIPYTSNLNSTGTHHFDNVGNTRYTCIMDSPYSYEHAIWTVAQWLPGGCFLKVDGIYADSLPEGRRCIFDTVHFHAWNERPADSIIWDFGDGTPVLRMAYDNGQQVAHRFEDTGFLAVRSIIQYADEGKESDCIGCKSAFTLSPDTLVALLEIRNRYDSAFVDTACGRTYSFRGRTFAESGLQEFSTYWHPSGCDTLWHLSLTVCPHCSSHTDTVYSEDLPWTYHGNKFFHEVTDYDVSFDIGESCDSLVSYTLVVLSPERRDSILNHANPCFYIPNIFTPDQASNREFRIIPDKITQMEVSVFDRRGVRVAHFDGLREGWDGTSDGTRCPQGAYVYFIRYRDTISDSFHTAKGTVTLLR